MKAAMTQEGSVEVHDIPTPSPGDDEALIRITASGVCHSDLHMVRASSKKPMPIGHEAIGIVEALGPGAERSVAVGDRVILGMGGMGGYWCGACEYCLRGLTRHCAQGKRIVGTFAEHIALWAPSLVPVPEAVADHDAPLACGGLTAYGAVKKLVEHDVAPGGRVAIVGAAGGLGHYAVQIAVSLGYEVIGVDVGEDKLEFLRSLGAHRAFDVSDAVEQIKALGGAHASLVFATRVAGFRLGLDALRPAGLFVAVALPARSEGTFDLLPMELFLKDPTIIYSVVGTVQDMREVVELAAAGKVHTHVARTGALSELPAIFDELAAAQYPGRAVITDLTG
ncbi:MAG TPA: zinc-binding dehydrogenase [Acidimicrobiia bacterium]|nr:zinc-binding dehydrogenase [Acidimicrobiia bacterium]